jgi:hypothetical protein
LPANGQDARHLLQRRGEVDRIAERKNGDDVAPDALLQLRGSSHRPDLAAVDDRDPVAEQVRLVEVVRGQEHRDPVSAGQFPDRIADAGARLRVEPESRFVEEQHPGRVDEAGRELEATPHSTGVGSHQPVGGLVELQRRQKAGDLALRLGAPYPVEGGGETQVLPPGELVVGRGLLEDDADPATHLSRLLHDVQAVDGGASLRRTEERREHVDRSRLPGAVRSEESEDLALTYLEGDARDGAYLAVEDLRQALGLDRVSHAGLPERARRWLASS